MKYFIHNEGILSNTICTYNWDLTDKDDAYKGLQYN